jgi:hypothetical protein
MVFGGALKQSGGLMMSGKHLVKLQLMPLVNHIRHFYVISVNTRNSKVVKSFWFLGF